MPPGPDLAEGAPKRRLPHPRVLLRRNRAFPIKWLAARSAGAAISARPVSDSKLRPLRRRHSQRASSRSAHRACMTMHDQPVPKTHGFAAHGAREIRRVKRAAAGPFVRSIDGLVARRRPSGQPHRTGLAVGIGLRRWDDITLGDGEDQGERAPSRRYGRPLQSRCLSAEADRSARYGRAARSQGISRLREGRHGLGLGCEVPQLHRSRILRGRASRSSRESVVVACLLLACHLSGIQTHRHGHARDPLCAQR